MTSYLADFVPGVASTDVLHASLWAAGIAVTITIVGGVIL